MTVKQKSVPSLKRESLLVRVRRHRIAYAFIAPAVCAMLLVHIIPSAQALYVSMLDLNVFNLLQYLRAPFIGLEHYQRILSGLIFGSEDALVKGLAQALVNSFWFTFWLQIGTVGLGLVLALLLNREFRGRDLARTLVLLPWVVPTFVVGLIWQFIWLQRGGLANRILVDWLHLADKPITWLLLENARIALVTPAIWRGLPFVTVTLLAALQVVPLELYEAAAIDGASAWQKFRYITLPFLMPIIVLNTTLNVIFNFFGFGPYNIAVTLFSTDKLGRYVDFLLLAILRQTWNNQLYGYGAAASVLVMLGALVFVAIWYRTIRSPMISE